jgi:hypothetical protein
MAPPGRRGSPWSRARGLPLLAALCLAMLPAMPRATSAPLQVRYPAEESNRDLRRAYPLAVLKLALDRSGQAYTLTPARPRASQQRVLQLVEQRQGLDVAWSVTTQARERRLRAVRFPIDRGLVGWRVLLVRRADAAAFARVDSVAGLRPLLAAQGHDWPDLAILRGNGLRVAAGTSYDGLFAMLARGHIDYLPRSVAEAGDELAARPELALQIEPHLLLHYPSALYFFVHPDNSTLAGALATGLQRAERDGSLARLFDRTYGAHLAALHLPERRVLRLDNPLLPADTAWRDTPAWQPGRTP